MPIFHLNVFNNVITPDLDGLERPDLEAAKADAIAGARDLVASDIREGRTVHQSHRIEITDDAGQLLHTVRYGDVVDLQP